MISIFVPVNLDEINTRNQTFYEHDLSSFPARFFYLHYRVAFKKLPPKFLVALIYQTIKVFLDGCYYCMKAD